MYKSTITKVTLVLSLCITLIGVLLFYEFSKYNLKELNDNANTYKAELEYTNNYIKDNIANKLNISRITLPIPKEYSNYISSPQGLRKSIKDVNSGGGSTVSQYHNAIDFACPEKTNIYSVNDGYVIDVYPSYYNGGARYKGHPTYGGLIVIKHNDGTTSLYAHLSMTKVKEGDYVSKGQCIGWSGGIKGKRGSGNSTGPHLHFAMYIDIMNLFQGEHL